MKHVKEEKILTLTYSFSSIFLPFNRNKQAWVSKSTDSTFTVNVVLTRWLVDDPVDDSFCTFL
jgi:hypothetical protein